MLGLTIATLSLTTPQRHPLTRRAALFSAASISISVPLAASSANDAAAKANQQLVDSGVALDELLKRYDDVVVSDLK